jgi:pre-mRNA-splicing helicase BRR2
MAEQHAKASQYQYAANSNLVLQADRSQIPRRDQEPSGEPESLWGKINPKEFGSRAVRDSAPVEKKKKTKEVSESDRKLKKKKKEQSAYVCPNQ